MANEGRRTVERLEVKREGKDKLSGWKWGTRVGWGGILSDWRGGRGGQHFLLLRKEGVELFLAATSESRVETTRTSASTATLFSQTQWGGGRGI